MIKLIENNKDHVLLALICLLIGLIHLFYPMREAIIATGIVFLSVFVNTRFPILITLATTIIKVDYEGFSTIIVAYVTLVTIYILIREKKGIYSERIKKIFSMVCISILISYITGYQSLFISSLAMISYILQMYVLAVDKDKNIKGLILTTFIVSGFVVGFYTVYLLVSGQANFINRFRLVYGDGESGSQIKDLAVAMGVPIVFLIYYLMFKKSTLVTKVIIAISLFALLTVVILTYARGVLLAIIVASVFLIIKYLGKGIKPIHFVLLGIASVLLFRYINSMEIDSDQMMNGIETGSGRTDIWIYYIQRLVNGGPLRMLFGFGAGDIHRITEHSVYQGFYAHSAILDFLFSYGLVGFYFICRIILMTWNKLRITGNTFYSCLFILLVCMFFPHGLSSSTLFLFGLSMCINASFLDNNYE